ncbi:MAG TPA: hypothetical protein VG982_01115 [Candidatus Paceibacterota bacterium]|nr:hypothetical protein [Candidatus Paceibacterota bacterium]
MKKLNFNQPAKGFLDELSVYFKVQRDYAMIRLLNAMKAAISKGAVTLQQDDPARLIFSIQGSVWLKCENIGGTSYCKFCEFLFKNNTKKSLAFFDRYKSIKETLTRPKIPGVIYNKVKRITLLNNLIDKLEEKGKGFVSNEKQFISLVKKLRSLIIPMPK